MDVNKSILLDRKNLCLALVSVGTPICGRQQDERSMISEKSALGCDFEATLLRGDSVKRWSTC